MENGKHTKQIVETIVAVFFAAILIFWFFVWPAIFPTPIGSYPVQRQEDGTLIPLNRTIYKVNPLMQTIIYWMPGIDESPKRLIGCAVRDKKNWSGYYPDGSDTVKMCKGKIATVDPNEIYVGRYHWWLLHFEIL